NAFREIDFYDRSPDQSCRAAAERRRLIVQQAKQGGGQVVGTLVAPVNNELSAAKDGQVPRGLIALAQLTVLGDRIQDSLLVFLQPDDPVQKVVQLIIGLELRAV